MRDTESLEQLTRVRLRVAGEREEHVLRPDVRRAELAGLLVRGKQRGFRVGRERRRDVGALRAIRLLLDLRGDRVGVGVDLPQHVAHDVVLQCSVEQVVGVEVETPPLERGVRGALEEVPRRVAEELRDVDPLDLAFALRSGDPAAAAPRCPARSKKSEKKSSKRLRPPPNPLDSRSSARSISQRYSVSCVPSGRSLTLDATAGRP